MAGNQTVLVAARDVSAGRKPASTGGCNRDVSADRTSRQYWGLPESSGRQVGSKLQAISSPMVHTANHPGMNKRPIEAAVLRCQSRFIIANQPTRVFIKSYK
jgi:hypothetical protein